MFELEILVKNSGKFDEYITKFEGNPKEYTSNYVKFLFIVRKSAEMNLLSENEKLLVRSHFFEEAVMTSKSLYEICLKVLVKNEHQKMIPIKSNPGSPKPILKSSSPSAQNHGRKIGSPKPHVHFD